MQQLLSKWSCVDRMIRELNSKECLEALTAANFGRLGCARENQPYVVPIFFAAADDSIYSFAIPGQKVDWMRDNPRVCLQFDNLSDGKNWTSVVVLGQFVELVDTPEHRDERRRAHTLLQARPMWWEPGAISPVGLRRQRRLLSHFLSHFNHIHERTRVLHRASGVSDVPVLAPASAAWIVQHIS